MRTCVCVCISVPFSESSSDSGEKVPGHPQWKLAGCNESKERIHSS